MKFSKVRLECEDPLTQGAFYRERLGMPGTGGIVEVGRTQLEFIQGQPHRYHLAFNWPRNQWEAGVQWLSSRVPLVASAEGQTRFEFENWQARSVYFWDPAGNLMEAIVRDRLLEERPQVEWLCVSEVGLVVEDVPQYTQSLELPVFGPCRQDFCALGDDEGLLIVTRSGRVWYPTADFAAVPAPVWLEFEGRVLCQPPEVR